MNIEEQQYLGILASEKDISGSPLREVAFVNMSNEMQYTVKAVCKEELPQQIFYGFINCLDEDCDVEEDYYLGAEERIDSFLSEVEDKLFLFSYMQKGQKYYNISEAHLIPKPALFDREEAFLPVPVFASRDDRETRIWERKSATPLYREYSSYGEFVACIENGRHVGRIIGYDAEERALPSIVIWKEKDGTLYAVDTITGAQKTVSQSVILSGSGLRRYELGRQEQKIIYNEWVNPTLLFLPQTAYEELKEEIVSGGCKKPACVQTVSTLREPSDLQEEEEFLKGLKQCCQEMDLQYREGDLVNFHTAVKCSDLVVLSGMSGTGKSALVDAYAKSLGVLADQGQLLFIPVSPSWNDDADLLGHIDLVNNLYHASDTGFVNLLAEAQKEENQDKLYLVCFDEMNLARVEHYFSQFLSILEKPAGERTLILYDRQYEGRLQNALEYPYKIAIGDNIKFIGTVNIDESTHHFSDKVLDRANVITLDIMDYSKTFEQEEYGVDRKRTWTAGEYRAMVAAYQRNQEIRCLLWEIHTVLQKANGKLGVGPRIVKSIEHYLANLPEGETIGLGMDEAVDYQVAQRVLTKVRGPESQLGILLKSRQGDGLLPIFDKFSHLSSFTKSRRVVEEKRKELEAYGYCV